MLLTQTLGLISVIYFKKKKMCKSTPMLREGPRGRRVFKKLYIYIYIYIYENKPAFHVLVGSQVKGPKHKSEGQCKLKIERGGSKKSQTCIHRSKDMGVQ